MYGVPGPPQVTTVPLPIDQAIETGVAKAVALTEPADADTEYGCQMPASIQSQVGRLTTETPDGLK
jgi:hypothetical protein